MYKNILICLDNSDHSTAGIDIGLFIARHSGSIITGCHVYAANLHNIRFRQMEEGLPPRYQEKEELEKQRGLHNTLITKGLKVISDSYLTVLEAKASVLGITVKGVQREGKNYEEIVKEASSNGYDLVVMGALGLGAVPASRIGSVAERVVRRASTDVLIVRDTVFSGSPGGCIVAAIDGSPRSFGALKSALYLAKVFNVKVRAVSAFDPDFHHTAFRSIAGVLTEEAGRLFRFKDQERLHTEIIDKGLEKIYRSHLDTAERMAVEAGVDSVLLSGKPFNEIIKHVRKNPTLLLVMGKTGVHASADLDIGSTAENCLRDAGCNVLISSREFIPEIKRPGGAADLDWTPEALEILERIPSFARGIVKNMVEEAGRAERAAVITAEFMRKVRKNL